MVKVITIKDIEDIDFSRIGKPWPRKWMTKRQMLKHYPKMCECCKLFEVEATNLKCRKIRPSFDLCKDCVRMKALEKKPIAKKEKKIKITFEENPEAYMKAEIAKIKGNITPHLLIRKFKVSWEVAKQMVKDMEPQ